MSGRYYEHLYIENLSKNVSFERQVEAVKNLGKLKSKMAIPLLKEIAHNSKKLDYIRHQSLFALIEIGDTKFIEEFKPIIENDEEIIEILIIAIGKLMNEDFLDEFLNFLNYPKKEIKFEIINVLRRFKSEKAISLLIKFYNDKDVEIKKLVKSILKESEGFKKYIEKSDENDILNLLSLVPEEKADKLIRRLIDEKHDDARIVKVLVKSIGELDLEDKANLLIKLYYKTNEVLLKTKILESFSDIRKNEKRDFLITELKNKGNDRNLRVKALFAMWDISQSEDVISLIKEIAENKEEWWMLRKVAIMLIGQTRNIKYAKFLISLLKEDDERVIRTIITELGELGDEDAIPYLEKYLNSKEMDLKKVTMYSLSKLGYKDILEILVNKSELREKLMPESLRMIINFNDERVVKILIKMLEDRYDDELIVNIILDGMAQVKSPYIEESLIKFIENKEVKREQRGKALLILSNFKTEKTKKLLEKVLLNKNEWWMMKKLALIVAKEVKAYHLTEKVLEFTNDLDERISKSAKETAKYFYENYFLEKLRKEKDELYKIGSLYLNLL